MNLFKFLGFFFAGLFIYATVVQFNDPDAMFWVAIYIIGAVVSVFFALNKINFVIPFVLLLGYIGLAIYYWPDQFEGVALDQGMKTTNIEKGRESLGAGMGAVIMLIYTIRLWRQRKA